MPTIDENRLRWNTYDWADGGDEWSEVWGGTSYLWWGAVYPRIQHLLPVPVILEIAPGFGRFTQFLKDFCDEMLLIDLSDRCLDGCRKRFENEQHLSYYLGDGSSLTPIPDRKVDFVFSFDSLVHCESEVIEGYLRELPAKLTATGTGFIHHSNFAALIDPGTGEASCQNEHWRATSVSADSFVQSCRESGLVCTSQELINWGGKPDLTDSLSTIAMPRLADAGGSVRRRENPQFMDEALSLGRIASFASSDSQSATGGDDASSFQRPDPALELLSFTSLDEYQEWQSRSHELLSDRRSHELTQAPSGHDFRFSGWCFVCSAPTEFQTTWDYAFKQNGVLTPNWREQILCPGCGLNGRMRATVHLLETELQVELDSNSYITEQTSPLYRALVDRHPGIVGSEFLRDGTPAGEVNRSGLRHEDLTRLSFAEESFDLIVSLDVLEHVPSYEQALAEAYRVLRPGGTFFFTAPFQPDSASNLVRARLRRDGTVEHLQPPEYHHDPLEERGVLSFYLFGWELLQKVRDAGFADVTALVCHSVEYGYWGPYHVYFRALRP